MYDEHSILSDDFKVFDTNRHLVQPQQKTKEEPHECPICGKICKTLTTFKIHLGSHYNKSLHVYENLQKPSETLVCPHCNKSFKYKLAYMNHVAYCKLNPDKLPTFFDRNQYVLEHQEYFKEYMKQYLQKHIRKDYYKKLEQGIKVPKLDRKVYKYKKRTKLARRRYQKTYASGGNLKYEQNKRKRRMEMLHKWAKMQITPDMPKSKQTKILLAKDALEKRQQYGKKKIYPQWYKHKFFSYYEKLPANVKKRSAKIPKNMKDKYLQKHPGTKILK